MYCIFSITELRKKWILSTLLNGYISIWYCCTPSNHSWLPTLHSWRVGYRFCNSVILWLLYLYDPIHNSFINSGRQDIRQLFTDDFKVRIVFNFSFLNVYYSTRKLQAWWRPLHSVAHFPPKLEYVAKQQLWNKCKVISSHLWRDYK